MFEVHGYFSNGDADAVAYAVTVGEPRDDAADTVGVVSGSPGVVSLLRIRAGQTVEMFHGPDVTLDVEDAATVLPALTAWTQVVQVKGEVPAART